MENSVSQASLESTARTGLANGDDWQEEVYQKIIVLKELYFSELNEMYQKFSTKLQKQDSLPHHLKSDKLEKLKLFKTMLEHVITFLQTPKSDINPGFKKKLGSYEKQIINFINTNRPMDTIPSMQGQLPQPHLQQVQSQAPQGQSHENQMNPQMQSMNMRVIETLPPSLEGTAQAGLASGGDWQEEIYLKIIVLKELYFSELNEMYQKVATKLQQQDSLSQHLKSDKLEKLKLFKTMLERVIAFIQTPKSNIVPGFKKKLGSYEKQIIRILNTNRPKKTIPSMQGQLPQPHLQQVQSQVPQGQSHENQMNPQMQSMSMQGVTGTSSSSFDSRAAWWTGGKRKLLMEAFSNDISRVKRLSDDQKLEL